METRNNRKQTSKTGNAETRGVKLMRFQGIRWVYFVRPGPIQARERERERERDRQRERQTDRQTDRQRESLHTQVHL